MSRILVTGGAGFIGSHITDAYIEQGHEVAVIDDLSTGKLENLNQNAAFYQADLANDDLDNVFSEFQPEIINHHAAQIDVRKSVEDPVFDASVNILGIIKLLNLSTIYGVEKVIFASSGGVVYGEPRYLPVDTAHSLNPLSPYGASKMSSEIYLQMYRELSGTNYVALRYGNVYGPRQDPHGEAGVIAIFIQRILNDQELIIFGNGEQLRDYIYIDDVVKANLLALEAGQPVKTNIGTGLGTSVNALAEILMEIADKKVDIEYKPARSGELDRIYLKQEPNTLQWQAETDLLTGLTKTVEYFTYKKGAR